ncbi:Crp/Fnr family transcriptional regulator [Paraburkholderia hospita]|uniref:Crp/Fnr family transcriptional regulator n=1 Tax=Paraburkholderia hospita TaxID=169430 RepID=A0ABN0FSJ9_9BURK|nr:helix-turn-helix domain-containing protein [Paraburkholderia hospita]EIN01777.1 Crp/Fnr family transcriptional regulator [Paraburkholderia hospita]OUL80502.1 Crp/Fnr family transcriptional regulator [Paraburkholderia hospita]OUL96353.1 Crp/Fnr family transcriptional regulator [Paraburkholderia hospita]
MFSTDGYDVVDFVARYQSDHTNDVTPSAPERPATRDSDYSMLEIWMPPGLTPLELKRIDSIICTTRMIKRGDVLFRANDNFQSLYAVQAGSFKTVIMHRDGREQVTGFQLSGDALGLGGVCTERYSCDAVAIEDSSVCIIPFHLLEILCREVKVIQHHVHRMMSGEIVRESGLLMLLGTMSAEERVAAFLLNMSDRLKARGYSSTEFNLPMTRKDMGSYLGMKLETVSRMFAKLQKDKLVDTHGKHIRILDFEGLRDV